MPGQALAHMIPAKIPLPGSQSHGHTPAKGRLEIRFSYRYSGKRRWVC